MQRNYAGSSEPFRNLQKEADFMSFVIFHSQFVIDPAERALVAANRELIARFEEKIKQTIARVWGEG